MPRTPGKPRSAEKLQGWKAAIHEYVKLVNQAEIELDAEPLNRLVDDREHLSRYGTKLDRLREREQRRCAWSGRNETKAQPMRVNEAAHEATLLLRLDQRRSLDQFGHGYVEERSEYERLWLQDHQGRWAIVRIEPLVSERRPRYGSYSSNAVPYEEERGRQHTDLHVPRSRPFVNRNLVLPLATRTQPQRYRRDRAVAYADTWWNKANPEYEEFEVNCTNYISQCLFAGGAPMNYTGRRESGWWYKGRDGGREWWSYSWAVSNAMQALLAAPRREGLRGTLVDRPEQLELGDVILYDWNGDGRYQHSTIVTAFDAERMPLVNANTVSSRHRYWDYRDSYAWTEATRYQMVHLADEF
ncbi:amidase domain-containing protein [Paenibacillus sp. 1P07SE]|uniref:amidase domain-containing protein n=1 Tax=Paenibacillus sp. 1P07SE TaxID=3132209 RepID=UPI0039A5EFC1